LLPAFGDGAITAILFGKIPGSSPGMTYLTPATIGGEFLLTTTPSGYAVHPFASEGDYIVLDREVKNDIIIFL
jgi:hypothetical protein